jgi:putative endonuclease
VEAHGYVVLARNYTVRGGELDIVARDGEVLCFVEVKSRKSAAFGSALEAIGAQKRQRMTWAAQRWLHEHPTAGMVRFDVIARDANGQDWTLIRDAFRPESP